LELRSTGKVHGEVFLDSDNLTDLDALLDVVAFQVRSLVVLVTERVFLRPWCLAELAVCNQQEIDLTCVYFAGCQKPSDEFIEALPTKVLDVQDLARFGLTTLHLQQALLAVQRLESNISMDASLNAGTLRELTNLLVKATRGPTSTVLSGNLRLSLRLGVSELVENPVPVSTGEVVVQSTTTNNVVPGSKRGRSNREETYVCADNTDTEAVASAMILTRLMPMCRAMEVLPDLLIGGEVLPDSATKCIFLCSANVLHNDSLLESMVVATTHNIFTLPVFLNDEFRVPSPKDFVTLQQESCYCQENLEGVLQAAHVIFRTIAVRFSPKEHFALMKMQVMSIGARVADVDVKKGETTTMTGMHSPSQNTLAKTSTTEKAAPTNLLATSSTASDMQEDRKEEDDDDMYCGPVQTI